MFEVGKVRDKDAAINVNAEVCVRGHIKIHIHPAIKVLICRAEGIYIAMITTVCNNHAQKNDV